MSNWTKETISEYFRKTAAVKKDDIYLKQQGSSISWKRCDELSDILAMDLIEAGVEKGERICVWSVNSIFYICALLAVSKAGACAVLLNPNCTDYEMDKLTGYAEISGMLCNKENIKRVRESRDLKIIKDIGPEGWEELLARGVPADAARRIAERASECSCEDFAYMLFTSGTTGDPKGVPLTHFQVLNIALRASECMHWKESDVFCVSLPFFHIFGLSTGFLASLFHKGTVCLNVDYHSVSVMKCIEENRCTVLNGVPTMFFSMIRNPKRSEFDISSLRSGILAGSGVYADDFIYISRTLDIPHLTQSYGMTETSPSVTFSEYGQPMEEKALSAGIVIPDVEVRICDIETGEVLPDNTLGEIQVRGFNTMKGYYKREEESKKAMLPDGWFKTGDYGSMDENGELHVKGRISGLIIRSGENISPGEIEEIMLKHPDIRQVKVFGVPEEVVQEAIAACVITERDTDPEELRSFVGKYLAKFKIPKYICYFNEFPLRSNGKVDEKHLKEMAVEYISGHYRGSGR